jgi:ATP-dependent RNA helicase DOB1
MLFGGSFSQLTPNQLAALISCVVFDEKPSGSDKEQDDSKNLPKELEEPFLNLQQHARRIAEVSKESGIEIDVEEYVQQYRPTVMKLVYEWTKGIKFSKLCEMTNIFEGSIIRVMRRLEELLRQCGLAAKSIGDTELEEKFTAAIELIKRDIVFAASLYL